MVESDIIYAFLLFIVRFVVIFERLAKTVFDAHEKKVVALILDQFQFFYAFTHDACKDILHTLPMRCTKNWNIFL